MKEIEKKLKNAFENTAPDIFDSVLRDCENTHPSAENISIRRKGFNLRRFAAVAAALAIIFGAAAFMLSNPAVSPNVYASVLIDVNPSLKLCIDGDKNVLSVCALNGDAEAIVCEADLCGSKLDHAVGSLVGSMMKHGYLSASANSLLLSVECDDEDYGKCIKDELSECISGLHCDDGTHLSVISQTVGCDDETKKFAREHCISEGKAQFIHDISHKDGSCSAEDLADLSINELNIIYSSCGGHGNAECHGEPGTGKYIGHDRAKDIALGDAECEDAEDITCTIGYGHHRMIYGVEFSCDGYKHHCTVDAVTGEVIDSSCSGEGHQHHGSEHSVEVSDECSEECPNERPDDCVEECSEEHAGHHGHHE